MSSALFFFSLLTFVLSHDHKGNRLTRLSLKQKFCGRVIWSVLSSVFWTLWFHILMRCWVFQQFLLSSQAAVLTSGPCNLRLHIIHLKDHSLTLLWQSPGLSSRAPWLRINELVLGLFGSRIINQQKSPLTSVRSLSPSTEGFSEITGSNTLRNHDGWARAARRFMHGNKCPFKQVREGLWIGVKYKIEEQ